LTASPLTRPPLRLEVHEMADWWSQPYGYSGQPQGTWSQRYGYSGGQPQRTVQQMQGAPHNPYNPYAARPYAQHAHAQYPRAHAAAANDPHARARRHPRAQEVTPSSDAAVAHPQPRRRRREPPRAAKEAGVLKALSSVVPTLLAQLQVRPSPERPLPHSSLPVTTRGGWAMHHSLASCIPIVFASNASLEGKEGGQVQKTTS
jgi:hypothetical protein